MIRQKTDLKASASFLDLVRAFPLRPIRAEKEHEAASKVLRRLVGSKAEGDFTCDERDYLEALTILVQDYQQKARGQTLKSSSPLQVLRHLMDESGMTVTDLGKVIGSRTAASMVLNGRRTLSKAHILRLAERFGVDPTLFLSEQSSLKGRGKRRLASPASP